MGEIIDASWMSEIENFPIQKCGNPWQQLVDMIMEVGVEEAKFTEKRGDIAFQMQRVASVATRVQRPDNLSCLTSPINIVKKDTTDIVALHILMGQFTPVVRNLINLDS